MQQKITKNIFIERAIEIHGDRYDYSLVEYKNNRTKVKIICKEHGIFEQNLKSHINKKYGCSKCSGIKKLTKEEFILKAEEHGIFEQIPDSHMRGVNCPKCKKYYSSNDQFLYFLYDNKYKIYKVGKSIDVERRCRELNSKIYKGGKNIIIFNKFENKANLENIIFEKFKKIRIKHPTYNSKIKSNGRTEWFTNIETINNYINERLTKIS